MRAFRNGGADRVRRIGDIEHVHVPTRRRATARTGRSPSRITPAIISFSPGSGTPALSASAISVLISSSVTPFLGLSALPEHSAALPEISRNQTSGEATFASTVMAGATRTAIASGSRSAICLGMSRR